MQPINEADNEDKDYYNRENSSLPPIKSRNVGRGTEAHGELEDGNFEGNGEYASFQASELGNVYGAGPPSNAAKA